MPVMNRRNVTAKGTEPELLLWQTFTEASGKCTALSSELTERQASKAAIPALCKIN
jgi:hypothetical protein